LHKSRHKVQWNRIEDQGRKIAQLQPSALWKKNKKHTPRKESLFNKWWWENWLSTCRIMKLETCLSFITRKNSKWIKDINVKPKTLKLLWKNSEDIGIGNYFLNRTPTAQEISEE
jgi:hypothetical protein